MVIWHQFICIISPQNIMMLYLDNHRINSNYFHLLQKRMDPMVSFCRCLIHRSECFIVIAQLTFWSFSGLLAFFICLLKCLNFLELKLSWLESRGQIRFRTQFHRGTWKEENWRELIVYESRGLHKEYNP